MTAKIQMFTNGDLVHIAKDLGSSMSHFTSDADAIVMYSYNDRYGGGDTKSYSLYIKGHGEVSWYYEHQLTLIAKDQLHLLTQWKAEADTLAKQVSDLDWIFKNGDAVIKQTHGSTIAALAAQMGITDLWGSRGEGVTYYENARGVLAFAYPYLTTGDKEGWLTAVAEFKERLLSKVS